MPPSNSPDLSSPLKEGEVSEKIKEKLERIRSQISPKVQLIAVTKGIAVGSIRLACHSGGQYDFGENRVQELSEKSKALSSLSNIRWHFLGHLQKNKIKSLLRIPSLTLLHSLDSTELAQSLNQHLESRDSSLDVLAQVNTSQEDTKYGCHPKELVDFVHNILSTMPRLRLKGLMCIAKRGGSSEENRICFRTLRELKEDVERREAEALRRGTFSMNILSMGMSSDYKIAIEEGSNMLRIGREIFGERVSAF